MTPADYPEFHEEWLNAHAISSSNKEPNDSAVQAVFDLLAEYPLQHVLAAIGVHAKKSRFAPTPADICEIIDARTKAKHVAADEAWVIAKRSMNESETVVLTDEIFQARNVAWELWNSGDHIGARMAFKSAYDRVIETSGIPVWRVVAGWDKSRVIPEIEKAKRLGRLPADYTPNKHMLPAPEATTTVSALLAKLEGHVERTETDTADALRNIATIRAMLSGDDIAADIENRERARQAFEQHRQKELSRLAHKAGELQR